jgi:Bifunctional DNA primase/polymerase, N-terminal/Primase C terminal 2 (PriCT-2)
MSPATPAKIKPREFSNFTRALRAALRCAERGWPIFPLWPRYGDQCACGDAHCKSPGKHPIGHLVPNGFKDATTDQKTISRWWREYPDAGIGMPTGSASGFIVIDVDLKNGRDGRLALAELRHLAPLPKTRTALTPSGGKHLYFEDPGGIRSSTDKLGVGLDVRGDGGYVVLPPSHDGLYEWVRDAEGYVNRTAELPEAWVEHLRSLSAPPTASAPLPAADPKVVAAALAVIPNGADVGWGDWNRVGMATFSATGGSADGFRAFDAWSAKWPHYDAAYTRNRWETYRRSPPSRIGAGTVFHLADEASPGWRDNQKVKEKAGTAIKQSDVLIELAGDADLFHTDEEAAFANIKVDEHVETWPIRSNGFRQWLLHRYFTKTTGAPNREAITSAIAVLEARARFDAPTYQIHLRTAGHNGKIYLDLCDEQWRAVEIDATDWRVVDKPPVRFTRARGMLPLPIPVKGGRVDDLQQFINIKKAGDFVLVAAYIVAALRDRGPYPILALRGEEGTGKSTLVRIIRSLVDPNKVPLRTLPREERDLYIAASNGYLLAFDNVSTLPPWLSDALCRLATGGGYTTRALYTDQDEVLIDKTRASLLNGIEDFVARPDLADRCIFIHLTPIGDDERRDEAELNAEFEAARPAILGALLDAVAHGLREWPRTRLKAKPRMADFARWATASEGAMFEPGSFEDAYRHNRKAAAADVIEADMVADAVRTFMREREECSGTAAELGDALEHEVSEKHAKSKAWPDNPRALRARLQRAQAPLRKIGIVLTFDRASRKHAIGIRTVADPTQPDNVGS